MRHAVPRSWQEQPVLGRERRLLAERRVTFSRASRGPWQIRALQQVNKGAQEDWVQVGGGMG